MRTILTVALLLAAFAVNAHKPQTDVQEALQQIMGLGEHTARDKVVDTAGVEPMDEEQEQDQDTDLGESEDVSDTETTPAVQQKATTPTSTTTQKTEAVDKEQKRATNVAEEPPMRTDDPDFWNMPSWAEHDIKTLERD